MNKFAVKLQLHFYYFNCICPSSFYDIKIFMFVILIFSPYVKLSNYMKKIHICIVNSYKHFLWKLCVVTSVLSAGCLLPYVCPSI